MVSRYHNIDRIFDAGLCIYRHHSISMTSTEFDINCSLTMAAVFNRVAMVNIYVHDRIKSGLICHDDALLLMRINSSNENCIYKNPPTYHGLHSFLHHSGDIINDANSRHSVAILTYDQRPVAAIVAPGDVELIDFIGRSPDRLKVVGQLLNGNTGCLEFLSP